MNKISGNINYDNAGSPLIQGSVLIMRFSALGDVAMTVPVIYSLAERYPGLQITVLSRKNFGAVFHKLPVNVHFLGIDLKEYRGIAGLNKLYRELKTMSFDYIADFHDVLRTKYLRFRFLLSGIPTAHINKGKKEKKQLTRINNKILKQLDTGFVRYRNVLEKLGFNFTPNFTSVYNNKPADISTLQKITGEKGKDKWLGIAPFARHKGKIYPLYLQEKVINYFAEKENIKLFIFGGGKYEMDIAAEWKEKYPRIIPLIGKLNMEEEIALLSHMDVVLSMDSANMHLASLVSTPVVSIWGATHPFAGFMGWNQSCNNVIQTDLYCRPCSVFGQKPCYRGDYACMYFIKPEAVIKHLSQALSKGEGL